ncbi:hypothetical protein ZHAS_00008453 [Anopheles sinensis]|uniref:Uncharacterized protein n=1 Tax=Anopheles sinensis TaxID=74873 RepID=A0A084VSG0_ANOSI|nr:hypothetical protein ZHAS_00008453 [Anopheles sinensis]
MERKSYRHIFLTTTDRHSGVVAVEGAEEKCATWRGKRKNNLPKRISSKEERKNPKHPNLPLSHRSYMMDVGVSSLVAAIGTHHHTTISRPSCTVCVCVCVWFDAIVGRGIVVGLWNGLIVIKQSPPSDLQSHQN